MMSTEVSIHHGRLGVVEPWPVPDSGAVVCFEGVVRPDEQGRPITALDYDVYQPMTQRVLHRLADQAQRGFVLLGVKVEHSQGRVAAGDCSFRLHIASAHRKEALAAMDWFIDQMKKEAPIWKRPVYVGAMEVKT